jgi:RimJ/RimL family protein N-acetyltransferase
MKILETERLVLCKLTTEDAAFILRLLNDAKFLQYIGDRGVKTLDDARKYILSGPVASYERFGFGLYLTKLKDDGIPIGICGLLKRVSLTDVDVGFAFLPEYRRKGYAYESASAVMDYGRTILGLNRIVAVTSPGNDRSIKIINKLGLTYRKMVKLSDNEEACKLFGIDFYQNIT